MKLIILDIDGVMTDAKNLHLVKEMFYVNNIMNFTAIKFLALDINVCFLSGDIWNKIHDMRNIKFYSGRQKKW